MCRRAQREMSGNRTITMAEAERVLTLAVRTDRRRVAAEERRSKDGGLGR
jgi:hypothetical protein